MNAISTTRSVDRDGCGERAGEVWRPLLLPQATVATAAARRSIAKPSAVVADGCSEIAANGPAAVVVLMVLLLVWEIACFGPEIVAAVAVAHLEQNRANSSLTLFRQWSAGYRARLACPDEPLSGSL